MPGVVYFSQISIIMLLANNNKKEAPNGKIRDSTDSKTEKLREHRRIPGSQLQNPPDAKCRPIEAGKEHSRI
jgi:hypothetical protein